MKLRNFLLSAVATFLFTQSSFGGITGIIYHDDGDGAFQCARVETNYFSPVAEANIWVNGVQSSSPGHLLIDVATDTELDPILTLGNYIDNDTGFAWAGYQVNITMNKPFTISNPIIFQPYDWSASVTQPISSGGFHTGQVLFGGSTPVSTGGVIDFGYTVEFLGAVSFCQEMIPIAVPEPAAASLLLGGGLLLGLMRRQRK